MFRRAALLSILMLFGVLLGAAPALAEAGFAPSPGQLEFGPVDMHFGGSPRQSVQFSNESQSALTVFSATITGADASRFQITHDGCSGHQWEPAEKCSVEVSYQPGAQAIQAATLELSDAEGSLEVPLSGSGITGTLSASPSPLSFSPIPYTPPGHEGEYQETEQVNVLNSQDAGTQIESVNIAGPDASSFSIQYGNCQNNLLAPGNWCDVAVRFAATSPGRKSASLVLGSDSSGTPLVVPLEGEALHGPRVGLPSTQALLGDVPIGSSAQHTFTVTNTGDYPLFIQQDFLISGTPLMFPVLSDACGGQIVYPSASCALTVGFEPTTIGEKGASIVFITNASPITVVGVDGVGVDAKGDVQSTWSLSGPSSEGAPGATQTPPTPIAAQGAGAGTPQRPIVEQAPRLVTSIGRNLLYTGLVARCPAQAQACEAVSLVTASPTPNSSRPAARRPTRSVVLVGSALNQLRGGQSTRMRVRVSRAAMRLLRRHGHLRVTIETMLRVDGKLVSEQTRVVTLVSPGTAARPGTTARNR